MKISNLILATWLAASAWAQAPPAKPQAETHAAAKPSGGAVASSPATPRKAGKSATASAPSSTGAHGKKQEAARRLSAPKTAAANRKTAHKGERDPFVSPIVERSHIGGNCTGSGRQCLFVGELGLQGVVQSPSGYIAVVVSGEHTYFLRENDPLADGDVERITKDTITMRQRSSDILGRPVVREVTRKLGVPAV